MIILYNEKDTDQFGVKEMPEMTVACLRYIRPYKEDEELFECLFQKLTTWLDHKGLLRFPNTKMLTVYHEKPEIEDDDKLRTSVCITVPADISVDGDIGKITIPGGLCVIARFELTKRSQHEDAWDTVMGGWLPESGYQPDDRVCYEIFYGNPKKHPQGIYIVDFCLPVKPM